MSGAGRAKEAETRSQGSNHWRGPERDGVHQAGGQGGAAIQATCPHGSPGILSSCHLKPAPALCLFLSMLEFRVVCHDMSCCVVMTPSIASSRACFLYL